MSPRCQLVVLRGRLWINPSGDASDLQCVARTRKGRRCLNPIEESGQVLGLHEFQLGSAGYVQAYGSLGGGDTVDVDRWLAQHCTLHDTPDVTDYETTELRRLEAAARLRPSAGYVNGLDYGDWFIEAKPDLLLAVAQLARDLSRHELAGRLERLSKPMCMEPLDAVLSYDAPPQTWCGRTVKAEGLPCELHTPERAADLGRCTWAGPGDARICRSAPLEGHDRCRGHVACCRAVKGDGTVCNRRDCRVPKHRQAPGSEAAAAVAQRCL